ncbi:hypothetical protein FHX79_11973 [Streptomyces cavourensis]|nr:hypothetical protein FHX79_11973 [Streptomyces cavourensis]GGU62001.1 hypothetical protein GCM10010498_19170 [Streptomyces cavourensis]
MHPTYLMPVMPSVPGVCTGAVDGGGTGAGRAGQPVGTASAAARTGAPGATAPAAAATGRSGTPAVTGRTGHPGGPARSGTPGGTAPAAATVRTGPVPVPVPAAVRFRAACPDCRGRFELAAGALRLAIGASRRTTFYTFTCPQCAAPVRKPAGERIIELLTGGGVRTLRLHATP